MAEPIKQEIINNIYENGEGLITGPVLQEVLLDMVDDYNDKVQAVDLSDSTGSWDDASDWVTENSGSIPTDEDLAILTGSIENWVEDQNYATTASVNELSESLNERIDNIITGSGVDLSGYLTTASYQIDSASFDERINSIPIPDLSEYATTESLNRVSESLAQEIADIDIPDISGLATTSSVEELSSSLNQRIDDIPQVDLSGYATTESVNEATQSVKEWVEAKHYLTTASLSGSVTEETVGFMINDATASVKDWVENQDYATQTYVSESIAGLDIPDTSGFVTTQSYNLDSASFDERIDNIDIPDVSIYATTESLNNLSESIANTYATEEFVSSSIADIEIPSIEGLATTESVNQLSESVAQTIADLPQVDLSGYATTSSVNTLVNETSESIKSWVEEQGYLTEHQDISGLATTSSVNELSESLNQRIDEIDIPDVSIYATTASVNELSESLNSVSSSFDQRISEITGSDISGYLTTASYLVDSASFDQRIESIPQVDLSGYATTSSVNTLSQSIADTIDNLEIPDVSGLATTSSVNQLSESVAQAIADIDIPDVSGLATTSSVTSLSESIAQDFDNLEIPDVSGLATTSSVNQLSASFDQRINNITGSGADLSGYALTASLVGYSDNQDITDLNISTVPNYYGEITESVNLGFSTLPEDGQMISIDVLNSGASASLVNIPDTLDSLTCVVNGVEGSGSCSIPAGEHGDIVVTRKDDVLYFRTSIDVSNISVDLSGYATTASVEGIQADVESLGGEVESIRGDLDNTTANWDNVRQTFENAGVLTYEIVGDEVIYTSHAALEDNVTSLSASLDTRINNISGSDLSGYATTSSVNQLSESLNSVSASFDTRINNITGSGGDSGIWERGLTSTSAIHKGAGNQASGACALAVGFSNKAIGYYTYAQGYRTVATGTASCAQGWGTSASGYAETALGVYNHKTSNNQVFSVGCGFSNTSRRNAISVIWDSGSVGGQTNTGSAEVYLYGVGNYLGQDTASAESAGKTYERHEGQLFGYKTGQQINSLSLASASTVYCNISADYHVFYVVGAPKDGATTKVVISNTTSVARSALIPASYGGLTYRFNGKSGTGSLEIPSSQDRCIYVTRRGNTLYLDSPVSSTELDNTVGNIEAALQALR